MTDPDVETKSSNGGENEKQALDDSVAVPMDDLDESKTQLINGGGGAGDHPEVAIVDGTDKSSDHATFNGLGKDEVMQYANDPFWVRLRWILFILFWIGWFAMLVTAVIIIVVAPRCPPRPDMKWYQKETVYQAYSKSFKDSNQDGVGDFKGLKDKFDYITDDLGIKAVYLNSIFKTDSSIDGAERDLAILDHKDLNPGFGATVSQFKSWIKDLRKKGQKVIVDLIPNLTSKNHTWFMKSAKGDDEFKDYYIWADGKGSGPPNNWKNMNGETAWTYDDTRKQYYYHSRSENLPDLNLNNKAVREEIEDIMKFWFGAGVGGFNILDLEYLVESKDTTMDDDNEFTKTRNNNGTLAFLEELRDVANSYSDKPGRERFLFGTVEYANENQTKNYWGGDDDERLHIVTKLVDLGTTCDALCMTHFIETLSDDRDQWTGLQISNQDNSRVASRSAGAPSVKHLVKAYHALQMLLPGTPFNYYGDEFGQKDGNKPLINNRFNPLNARTPMQWSDEDNAGFTEPNVTPWLSVGQDYQKDNLRVSRSHFNEHSILENVLNLIELREKESFQWGKTKACAASTDVLLFTRKAERFPFFLTLMNVGQKPSSPHIPSIDCVESKDKAKVVFHSRDEDEVGKTLDLEHAVMLNEGDIVVLEFAADD